MADGNDGTPAQAAVFCAELHRHIESVDGQASSVARKLRGQMDRQGPTRRPDVVASLHEELRILAVERRRLLDMLTAMGHEYPCNHATDEGRHRDRGDSRSPLQD